MFFSFNHNGQWNTFVKGQLYISLDETYCYSSSPIVTTTVETIFTKVSNILRKMMLYKLPADDDDTERYAVIDFCRPTMPLSPDNVIIPIYPMVGDMLKINGAHVLSVNPDS